MKDNLKNLAFEIELQLGERLTLPPALLDCVGPGRWIITIEAVTGAAPIRGHDAFLNGYCAEDEGLYDDHPAR